MEMISEGAHIARQEGLHAVQAAQALRASPGEYLTFRLASEEYGVQIRRVQEIRSYESPTRIPGAPAWVKGVVNLRGVIVPIVDLRMRLGCSEPVYDRFTVVIVLALGERVIGAVVDSVCDVVDLPAESIQPPPPIAQDGSPEFITGVANVGERMLMLSDLEALLAGVLTGVAGTA